MVKIFLVTVMTMIFTIISPGWVSGQEDGNSLSLRALIDEALQNNPDIQAADHRWRAAEEKPAQVSSLPDPIVSYSRFGSSIETRLGPQESVYALSQRIPFPGKLGLQGEMATQDAVVTEQDYEATKRDIIFKVKNAYYDLYWIDQTIATLERYLTILQDFTGVAEQKYATGKGIQANVLKSQVEISAVVEKKLSFAKLRESNVAQINALLDRPQSSGLGMASEIDTNRVQFNESVLVDYAVRQRQELQSARAMIQKSEFMKNLAKKEYLPDFNLQANYIDISKGMSTAPTTPAPMWATGVNSNF